MIVTLTVAPRGWENRCLIRYMSTYQLAAGADRQPFYRYGLKCVMVEDVWKRWWF